MTAFLVKRPVDDVRDEGFVSGECVEKPKLAKAIKKKKKVCFNKDIASRTPKSKPEYTLAFSDFIERSMQGVGDAVFKYALSGSPLATKSAKLRGMIAEEVVKRGIESEIGEDSIVPAEASDCVNGSKRGKGNETYDFGVRVTDGSGAITKVEVKNARLYFNTSKQCWVASFVNVKSQLSDMVLLVLEGLDAVRVYEWRGLNVATNGKSTTSNGNNIAIYVPRNEPDFDAAYNAIAVKLDERNYFASELSFAGEGYHDLFNMSTRTEDVMESMPLSILSYTARGDILENLVRSILRDIIGSTVSSATVTERVNGSQRGSNSTEYDFTIDGDKRVEVKSSLLSWNKTQRGFKLQFQAVKPDSFDLLFLAWCTPKGVHVFEHDPKNGYSTNGKQTDASGGSIQMCAPSGNGGYRIWTAVEAFFLKQFRYYGSKHVAYVEFGEGDVDNILEYGKSHCSILGGGEEEKEEEETKEESKEEEAEAEETEDEDCDED